MSELVDFLNSGVGNAITWFKDTFITLQNFANSVPDFLVGVISVILIAIIVRVLINVF